MKNTNIKSGILLIALVAMTMMLTGCPTPVTPTYTVSYDGNGATSGTAPVDSKEYKSGESATILGVGTLGKTGNNFAGWTLNAAGTGTVYTAGQSLSIVGDVTFYAKWNVISTPSASLYAQDGTLTAPATFPIKADISLAGKTVQTAKVYTTGDVFIGDMAFVSGILWQYNAVNVLAGNYAFRVVVVFTDSTTITSNSELFVVNAADTHSVTYHDNGATSGTPPTDTGSYASGSNVTVKDAGTLAKTYHSFGNWNTKADGTGSSYAIGSTLVMGSANIDLYPVWEKIAVTSVTLDTHTLNLKIGESATLTVTVSPPTADPDVSWNASSVNATVTKLNATQARVDAVGVVTGATVDVASSWSPTFNDVCTVNVTSQLLFKNGVDGKPYRMVDGGDDVLIPGLDTGKTITAMAYDGNSLLFKNGVDGKPYRMVDGGDDVLIPGLDTGKTITAMAYNGNSLLFINGMDGKPYRMVDGGDDVLIPGLDTGKTIVDISFDGFYVRFKNGMDGKPYRMVDGGDDVLIPGLDTGKTIQLLAK